MNAARVRLDVALVAAGLAPTREKAQALILAGRVLVDGARRDKPGVPVTADARVEVTGDDRPFASRGGQKLAPALDRLGIDPSGLRCLDVGASTGGFTDVLLRRGAAHVTALDVGRGLLDAALRADPRVVVVEEVNARAVRPADVLPPYDLVTVDVSFISLALVLPALLPLAPRGAILVMVKPQFEVGRREAAKGEGVVRDPALRAATVDRIAAVLEDAGWGIRGVAASSLAGPRGNREFFLHAAPGPGLTPEARRARIDEEVARDS